VPTQSQRHHHLQHPHPLSLLYRHHITNFPACRAPARATYTHRDLADIARSPIPATAHKRANACHSGKTTVLPALRNRTLFGSPAPRSPRRRDGQKALRNPPDPLSAHGKSYRSAWHRRVGWQRRNSAGWVAHLQLPSGIQHTRRRLCAAPLRYSAHAPAPWDPLFPWQRQPTRSTLLGSVATPIPNPLGPHLVRLPWPMVGPALSEASHPSPKPRSPTAACPAPPLPTCSPGRLFRSHSRQGPARLAADRLLRHAAHSPRILLLVCLVQVRRLRVCRARAVGVSQQRSDGDEN